MRNLLQRKWRHLKHRMIYKLGGSPTEKIPWDRFHSMGNILAGLRTRGHRIETVVDVGASDGQWTKLCLQHFPDANYLLLEPNSHHFAALNEFCSSYPNITHIPCVAGRKVGHLAFSATDPYGGVASESSSSEGNLPATSIDHEIGKSGAKGPLLIKLDTHGFEIPILEGAITSLAQADAVIIECYTHPIAEGCLVFWEMCAKMSVLGFCCMDLADSTYRRKDGTLWQMDLLFVRKDRTECQDHVYE